MIVARDSSSNNLEKDAAFELEIVLHIWTKFKTSVSLVPLTDFIK
jgi:hypothetical protein